MQQQQQQQQQGGSSHYGVPSSQVTPFSPSTVRSQSHHLLEIPSSDHLQHSLPEAAAPISIQPPAGATDFDDLPPSVAAADPDDEAHDAVADAGRGSGAVGNRWPQQETLTLLKIRSEMDAAFRDATLKGPLWEEVARKLSEHAYSRSAMKCKEKFENVYKYYKRTKDGRAGRQDGKSYRFFSELEALYRTGGGSGGSGATSTPAAATSTLTTATAIPPVSRPQPISLMAPPTMATPTRVVIPEPNFPGGQLGTSNFAGAAASRMLFSSHSSSSSSASESDGEETEEVEGENREGRKRERGEGWSGRSRKMMAFFDQLIGQVLERQEEMQQRFLEAIEKREQDRIIRDDAWRRQEAARLSREQELLAQERAITASRDNAIISYLQKFSNQPIQIPSLMHTTPATPITISPQPPPAALAQQPSQLPVPALAPLPPQQKPQLAPEQITIPEAQEAARGSGLETMSLLSRWPKAEVHALINLRSGLDSKYQETGPKGTLWEEISAGMQRLGYNRSAKRCKEKWENINKYFKKVKERNKKRPQDSKTCPYFHQLDALYRNKFLIGSTSTSADQQQLQQQQQEAPPPPPPQQEQQKTAAEAETNLIEMDSSNGGVSLSIFDEESNKPEDIVTELLGQQTNASDEDDSTEREDDDDEDQEEKSQYMNIQFQNHNVNTSGRENANRPYTSVPKFVDLFVSQRK